MFRTFIVATRLIKIQGLICFQIRAVKQIGLLRKMQILEPLQFWLSVFYHIKAVNKYRKFWTLE